MAGNSRGHNTRVWPIGQVQPCDLGANKADALTRVRIARLKVCIDIDDGYIMCNIEDKHVKTLHEMHHMGVGRTLFLARKVNPTVSWGIVCKVVWVCQWCQSTDPVLSLHDAGEIHVSNNWVRLARNITHYWNVGGLWAW